MIRLERINKKFKGFSLEDISLDVSEGEYFVLLGMSGSGKSLILEIIAGLQKPSSGRVIINGVDITSLPIHKRNIGFVFQNHALFPHMTVKENIYFSLTANYERNSRKNDIDALAEALGISHLMHRYPLSLSHGEAHRVALARTLVRNPICLLLDEPLSSIDAHSKYEIRSLLRKINKGLLNFGKEKKPLTTIHVTHDYEEALALASKIAVIDSGRMTHAGNPEDIFKRPKTSFIAKFLGIKNFYKGRIFQKDNSENFVFSLRANQDIQFIVPAPEVFVSDEYSITIRSEDVILAFDKIESSIRNIFKGKITDIENVVNGVEVTLDIGGSEISSLITYGSFKKMNLSLGQNIYAGFKASSVRFA